MEIKYKGKKLNIDLISKIKEYINSIQQDNTSKLTKYKTLKQYSNSLHNDYNNYFKYEHLDDNFTFSIWIDLETRVEVTCDYNTFMSIKKNIHTILTELQEQFDKIIREYLNDMINNNRERVINLLKNMFN